MDRVARYIAQVLKDNGHQAVFCGGVVRDMILELPNHDVDVCTSATPDQVEALFDKTLSIGKSFGVIVVIVDGVQVEVATFRTDGIYKDGRRPESVEFSSMEEDAKRRDFTINGLFYDPIEDMVIDHVGGIRDLQKGVIRFIGDPEARIAEDRLRILRGVRFAIRFGFEIEPETLAAIKRNADKVLEVSAERIQQELIKIVELGKPRKALELLSESGILKHILPEIEALKKCKQDPVWHPEGDTLEHTIRVMENLVGESLELQFSALFHDVGKPETTIVEDGRIKSPGHAKAGAAITRQILERLKFSNKFIDYVGELVYDHMKIIHITEMRKSAQKKFFAQESYLDLRKLHIADKKAGSGDTYLIEEADELYAKFQAESLKPKPFVDGRDLIAIGFTQGRAIGALKDEIYDLQLEGILASRESALSYAKGKFEGDGVKGAI